MFLSKAPAKGAVAEIAKQDHGAEVVDFDGTEVYVWTPDGVKAMTVSNTFLEKKLGVAVTARNWNALGKIVAKL